MKKIFFFIFVTFYPLSLFAACFSDIDLGNNMLTSVSKFSSSKLGIVVSPNDTDLNKAENFVVVAENRNTSLINNTSPETKRILDISSANNDLKVGLLLGVASSGNISDAGKLFNFRSKNLNIPYNANTSSWPGINITVPIIVKKKVFVNGVVNSNYAFSSQGKMQLGRGNDGAVNGNSALSSVEFYATNQTVFRISGNSVDHLIVNNSGVQFGNEVDVGNTDSGEYTDIMTLLSTHPSCSRGGRCGLNTNISNTGLCQGGLNCWYYSKILYNWQNDLAEFFPSSDITVSPGEIVMADPNEKKHVRKADRQNKEKIIGVVSTNPALCFEEKSLFINENKNPIYPHNPSKPAIALKGRVPVKISLEGGSIKIGDLITISSVAGVGMKQNTFGRSVGVALEDYSEKKTENDTIYVFINPEFQFGKISKDNIKKVDQISKFASSLEKRAEKNESLIQEIEKILL